MEARVMTFVIHCTEYSLDEDMLMVYFWQMAKSEEEKGGIR